MPITGRSALPVAAVAAIALLTSCAGTTGTVAATPAVDAGPSAATVAWADGVCGAVRPFVEAVAAGPQSQINGSDAVAAIAGLSAYFGKATTAVDGTIATLGTTSPAPVAGGDAVLKKMIGTYTSLRASLQDAKAKVDAVDATNPQSIATALPAAVSGLPATLDPTADLKADPQLSRAVAEAASCKALPAVGS